MITHKPFRFKQFFVDDSTCAMKVGTDGVILGAWVNVSATASILDIGTGCGLIALMVAQRSKASITAIDIDEGAALQSTKNFRTSPWKERMESFHTAIQQFHPDHLFDLLISNPPFFRNALKAPEQKRSIARHNDTLSYESLLFAVDRLLDVNGSFAFILPVEEAYGVITMASTYQLHLNRCCTVFSKEDKMANRIMAEISRKESEVKKETLVIRDKDNQYTAQYKELTKDFYLFLTE